MAILGQRALQTKGPANAKTQRQNTRAVMEEPQGRPCGGKEVSKRKVNQRRCSQRQILRCLLGHSGASIYCFK